MANDLNCVSLVGNLTRDMEVSYTSGSNGLAIGKMSIASNKSVKRGENWETEVSYFDLVMFGKPVENLKQYLVKGTKIGIVGQLKQDRWQDKAGDKHSRISVVVDNLQLLGGRPENQNTNSYNNQNNRPVQNTQNVAHNQQSTDFGYDQDIPF